MAFLAWPTHPSKLSKDTHLVSITQGGLEEAPYEYKIHPIRKFQGFFEAWNWGKDQTYSFLYDKQVGICGSNEMLSGYMRSKHLDLQVSWKLKPEDKAFRFGKKILMDGGEKVGSEGNDSSYIYTCIIFYIYIKQLLIPTYLSIYLTQQYNPSLWRVCRCKKRPAHYWFQRPLFGRGRQGFGYRGKETGGGRGGGV